MRIAFDVDGTLIDRDDTPRRDVLTMLKLLSKKHTIIVWSGGGANYAAMWVRRLKLEKYVSEVTGKTMGGAVVQKPDIAIDDQEVTLGDVNIVV